MGVTFEFKKAEEGGGACLNAKASIEGPDEQYRERQINRDIENRLPILPAKGRVCRRTNLEDRAHVLSTGRTDTTQARILERQICE